MGRGRGAGGGIQGRACFEAADIAKRVGMNPRPRRPGEWSMGSGSGIVFGSEFLNGRRDC